MVKKHPAVAKPLQNKKCFEGVQHQSDCWHVVSVADSEVTLPLGSCKIFNISFFLLAWQLKSWKSLHQLGNKILDAANHSRLHYFAFWSFCCLCSCILDTLESYLRQWERIQLMPLQSLRALALAQPPSSHWCPPCGLMSYHTLQSKSAVNCLQNKRFTLRSIPFLDWFGDFLHLGFLCLHLCYFLSLHISTFLHLQPWEQSFGACSGLNMSWLVFIPIASKPSWELFRNYTNRTTFGPCWEVPLVVVLKHKVHAWSCMNVRMNLHPGNTLIWCTVSEYVSIIIVQISSLWLIHPATRFVEPIRAFSETCGFALSATGCVSWLTIEDPTELWWSMPRTSLWP